MSVLRETIAIIDDTETIRETVKFALEREGYQVTVYQDGLEAWEAFQDALPDLAVLDILMPRMDGLELCRKLRTLSDTLPIIFLTSKVEEFDRVMGLEIGADDYLCKPFSARELVVRVKVLFRRLTAIRSQAVTSKEDMLQVDELELDLLRYTVKWKSSEVPLTVTEFMMLHALARQPGHVKTRKQLMEEGYPHDAYVSERTIDSHIKRLRKKMLLIDAGFENIETVHGLGYRYRRA